jgi:hypothetical protein
VLIAVLAAPFIGERMTLRRTVGLLMAIARVGRGSLGAELGRNQVLGPRAQAGADVIARDGEIGTVICNAAHHEMHARVDAWAMASPVWPDAEIALHLADEVTRSRVKALRSIISAASSGVKTKRK